MPALQRRKSVDSDSDSEKPPIPTKDTQIPQQQLFQGVPPESSGAPSSGPPSARGDPPPYSPPPGPPPQQSGFTAPSGSGHRILFPRQNYSGDQAGGFGAQVAEDWAREPVFCGTAFHGDGSKQPAKVVRRSNGTVECQYGWGGGEHTARNFDVLIYDANWMEWVDPNAVRGRLQSRIIGGEDSGTHAHLYHTLTKVTLKNENRDLFIPGKTSDHFPQGSCNFSFGGMEYCINNGRIQGGNHFAPQGQYWVLCWRS